MHPSPRRCLHDDVATGSTTPDVDWRFPLACPTMRQKEKATMTTVARGNGSGSRLDDFVPEDFSSSRPIFVP